MHEVPATDCGECDLGPLLVRLRPRLAAVMHSFRIPLQDQEDILQDTALILLMKTTVIENREAWLVGTLRNRCRMFWRARRTNREDPVEPFALDAFASASAAAQPAIRDQDLRRLVARLRPRLRRLLQLRFGLGYTAEETATRLGYRPASMKRTTNRCLKTLRRGFNENAAPVTP